MPSFFRRLAAHASGDDEQAGGHAFQHENLLARNLPAVAVSCGKGGDLVRAMVRAFVDGEGRDQFTGGDLRQPGFLLRVRTAHDDGAGGGERRGQDRRGRQGAAGFFKDQAETEVAEVGAAVLFRDDHAGPAHLRHFGESGGIVAQGRSRIAHLPESGNGRLLLGPRASGIAQQGLFFGQYGHGLSRCLGVGAERVGQAENPLGDDVALNFGGAAVDREGLPEQPGAYRRLFVGGEVRLRPNRVPGRRGSPASARGDPGRSWSRRSS